MGPFGRQAPCVARLSSTWSRCPLAVAVADLLHRTGTRDQPGPAAAAAPTRRTALEAAAGALADALASGDFSDVGLHRAPTRRQSARSTPPPSRASRTWSRPSPSPSVADPSGEQPTAAATFDWTWPIGPDGWTYSSQATFSEADGQWLAEWDVATIEPSLNTKVTLDLVSLGAKRGDILGAGGLALVTNRPVVRIGIDRSKVGAGKAVRVGPRARAARRHRRRGVRQAGRGLRAARVRRGDRLPPGRGAGRRALRRTPDQGRRGDRGRAAARADQGVRRADPRLGRRGDRRDDRGEPRRLRARRRRRVVRAPGAVRRAAARHARPGRQRGRLRRQDPRALPRTTPSTGSRCS